MRSHLHKATALNEPRPPLAPPPAPAPKAAPALSFYDSMLAAQQRRAEKLALAEHTTPTPTKAERRRQLKSQERALLRELDPIENELASVRRQLAAL
jgi:hypothetical protein